MYLFSSHRASTTWGFPLGDFQSSSIEIMPCQVERPRDGTGCRVLCAVRAALQPTLVLVILGSTVGFRRSSVCYYNNSP
jgi:hypothetical protein